MKLFSRIFALFLVAVMAFSLVACDESAKPAEMGMKGTIEQGIQKVKDASSYTFVMTSSQQSMYNGQLIDMEMTYACDVIEKENGETTIYIKESTIQTMGEETREYPGAEFYFDGKTGYVVNTSYHPTRLTKYEMDKALTLPELLADEDRMFLDSNLVDTFCGFNPTQTNDSDGSTTYTVSKLTMDQYVKVMADLTGETEVVSEEYVELFNQCTITVTISLDAQGCFQDFRMVLENVPMGDNEDDPKGTAVMSFAVTDVGKVDKIDVPEFTTKWIPDSASSEYSFGYCKMTNGIQAHYELNRWGNAGWCFVGMGRYYWHTDVVENYVVLSEIAGLPVDEVTDTEYIKNIVIPAGAKLNPHCSYDNETDTYYWNSKDTVVYFEDAESKVEKNFVVGESNDENVASVKGVYYAGQWELIDGVPTPKN